MRRVLLLLSAILLAMPLAQTGYVVTAHGRALQDGQDDRRVLTVPDNGRRRRVRSERRRGRGIKGAFARAGRGAGRGGKRFGQNIAKGRPVRAGKELGKGMGTFGKYTGKGVARTAKRVFKP
ncbi:MAG TPA: hypothetical protein VJS44_08990 [Pyrinomonadaceae bacterium]|nr:hypothetical protein [Pyrinomonadaceae bacterium]